MKTRNHFAFAAITAAGQANALSALQIENASCANSALTATAAYVDIGSDSAILAGFVSKKE